ncbi:MAG: PQQ-binding-like beta-propeller repeat protein [Caldilineales bacterium]
MLGYEQGVLLFDTPTFGPSSLGNPPPADQQYLLTALDWATGNLLWQGYLADPRRAMVDEDGVVINVGNQLQRRSLRDGAAVWTTTLPVDDHGLWVSRAVRNDETLLIGSDSGVLYALDHLTGELLWMEDMWGMLGLPWRPVTPLAVEDDTVLVWMSAVDGDAVAGLRRGGATAPWPTPTFLPDSAWDWPAPTATPVPTPGRTVVPADWTPEPVRWEPSNTTDIPRVELEMRDLLLTWLNLHPGDYDGFIHQISQWPSRPYAGEGTFDFPPDYVSWVDQADLDGDGSQEDIVALGVRLKSLAVLKNAGQQTRIVYASEPNFNYLGATPEFVLADDINCDGQVEIVLQWRGSGTWGDFIIASVFQWDGSTWRDLGDVASSGYASIRGQEPSVEFVDTDGDGCLEAVATYVPSHQSVTRPQTWTYAFRDGRYQQIDAVGVPSHMGYYKVIDANRAVGAAIWTGRWNWRCRR